jgi:very-short-patch-repair endonuclease
MAEASDEARSTELARRGYRVIRFWNNEVVENLSGVLEGITRELVGGTTNNPLSAQEGGEGGTRSRQRVGG